MDLKKTRYIILFLLFIGFQSFSQTKNNDIEIGVVTVSAGPSYYEAFGHSAIRVKGDDFDYTYGFGYFNFNEENFFTNFLMGKMIYFLGVQDSFYEIQKYRDQGRKVSILWLNLTDLEEQSFLQELNHLAKPQNRNYPYDYFENNCTSKIRDMIVSHFSLSNLDELKQNSSNSLYEEIFPVENQSWMNLGFAIGFGLPVYNKKSEFESIVFPEKFEEAILNNSSGLIKNTEIWNQPSEEDSQNLSYDFIKTHGAVIFTTLLLLVLFFWFKENLFFHLAWQTLLSLVGLFLLFLWFFTQHKIASMNLNLLLFFPLSFLLLFSQFRMKWFLFLLVSINLIWLGFNLYLNHFYLLGWSAVNLVSIYYFFTNFCKDKIPKF